MSFQTEIFTGRRGKLSSRGGEAKPIKMTENSPKPENVPKSHYFLFQRAPTTYGSRFYFSLKDIKILMLPSLWDAMMVSKFICILHCILACHAAFFQGIKTIKC